MRETVISRLFVEDKNSNSKTFCLTKELGLATRVVKGFQIILKYKFL